MMTVNNLIKRFAKYELITGILCILLPFILIILEGTDLNSISSYAYSRVDFVYVWLITMAATLIIVTGVRQNKRLTWFMGLCLLIVPITPYKDYNTIHFIAAGLFFLCVMIDLMINTQKLYGYRMILASMIGFAFAIYYLFNLISLFWVESISLIIFGINFLLDLIYEKEKL